MEKAYAIDEPKRGYKRLIATRDLPRGTTLLTETPLLKIKSKDLKVEEHNEESQIQELLADQVTDAEYCQLQHEWSPSDDPNQDLTGIYLSVLIVNGIDVYESYKTDDRSETIKYDAVFADISRINHSCPPNAFFSWDQRDYKGCVQIIRDIKQGEEITRDYRYTWTLWAQSGHPSLADYHPSECRRWHLKEEYEFDCSL
jgi:hypothetical protein